MGLNSIPSTIPRNVDNCYHVQNSITREDSRLSQLLVDDYIMEICDAVKEGIFTKELGYLVVLSGSRILIAGVPANPPTRPPTNAPTPDNCKIETSFDSTTTFFDNENIRCQNILY